MHIHASQIYPYAALDALRSEQRTAAKQEAKRIRKRLVESASELAESEFDEECVVKLASQRQPRRRNQQDQENHDEENHDEENHDEENLQGQKEQSTSEEADNGVSNWA